MEFLNNLLENNRIELLKITICNNNLNSICDITSIKSLSKFHKAQIKSMLYELIEDLK